MLNNNAKISDIISALQEIEGINAKADLASVVGSPARSTDTMATIVQVIQNDKNILAANLNSKRHDAVGTDSLLTLANRVENIEVGKRWASGTTTSLTSPSRISVSGLGFIPSIFLCYFSEGSLASINFFQKLFVIFGPNSSIATTRNNSNGDSSGQIFQGSIVNNSLGNFEMKIQHSLWGVTSNLTVNWVAIE